MRSFVASGLRSFGFLGNGRRRSKEKRRRRPTRPLRSLVFEPLEVRQLLTATVNDLHLLNDTGSSSSDLVTSDPQVTGTVQGDFSGGYVEVQFDHFGDGNVDGYTQVYSPGSQVTYDPRSDDYSLSSYAGSFTLNYRTVEYDSSYNAVTGGWQSFTFTLEIPAAPEISLSHFDTYGYEQDLYDGYGNLYFDGTTVGSPVDKTLTIHNRGTSELTLDGSSLTLPDGFSVVTPFTSPVAPEGSTSLTIRLNAAVGGQFQGTLSFANNDADENPFEFTIYGDVTAPQPEIAVRYMGLYGYEEEAQDGYSSVQFDSTAVGTPVDKMFTIQNTGTAALLLEPASLTLPTGFSLATPFASSVAPGGSTAFTVRLAAASGGQFQGAISFTSNDADENPFEFNVYGDVWTPQPEVAVRYIDAYGYEQELYDGSSNLQFDSTSLGTPIDKTLTILNTGAATLTLDSASLVLPAGFSVVTPFAATVAPDGTTAFTVRLSAGISGQFQGSLSFGTNDEDENPFELGLSGQVSAPQPEIAVRYTDAYGYSQEVDDGYSTVSFESTLMGLPVDRDFTVHNTGDGTLVLDLNSFSLPAGFALLTAPASSVAAGDSTTFTVRVNATSGGQFQGQMSFPTNDADENPFEFWLYGQVSAPEPEIAVRYTDAYGYEQDLYNGSSSVSFGATAVDAPVSKTFSILNTGDGALTLDSMSLSVPAGFTVVTPFGSTVQAGGSTVLTVRLNATGSGQFSGTLSFASNDADESPFTFALQGEVTGGGGEPEIAVAGPSGTSLADGYGSYSFGTTAVATPISRTFTVRNDGMSQLTLDASSLQLPAGFTLVTAFASPVAAGATTSFTVRLDAASAGQYQGTLSFTNGDADENPFDFQIQGTVTQPEPEIAVRYQNASGYQQDIYDGNHTVYFPNTTAGQPVSQTFAIHNTGTAPLTLDTASFSLPQGFSLLSSFASEVAAGGSTAFSVQLDAQAGGQFQGSLSFANGDANENPFDFFLYGNVTAPQPEIAIRYTDAYGSQQDLYDGYSSLSFGSIAAGVPVGRTFAVYNTGQADLTLDSASLSLPSGFSLVSPFAASVAAGTSTTFTVQLDAATGGQFQGTLSFGSNDADENPFSWTVSGTVIGAATVVSVHSTQDAVEGGQAGYIRLARTGDTSQELTVNYSIDSTGSQATPGTDFSYLSGTSTGDPNYGSITFGLGASSADVSVVALGDGLAEGDETLRIVLGTNSSGYELGSPYSATIVLQDGAQTAAPVVSIGRLADEVQTIVLPDATAGTWTIALGSDVTEPLSHDASALTVQAALESLAAVGVGNVTVSGDGDAASPLTIAFREMLAATDLPQLQVDVSGLTGVPQPAANVIVETEGVDGSNEAYEIVVRSLDGTTDLAAGAGNLRFFWGPVDAQADPLADPQRQSPPVAWDASVAAIQIAIGQIPHLAGAGGTVSVTEVVASAQMRRLRVEFTGDLGSQDVTELAAHNDAGGDAVTDVNSQVAVLETNKLADGAPGSTNEVQTLTLSYVQAGTFQTSYRGLTTPAIAFDAAAVAVQEQLEALDKIGTDNVTVTGPNGGPWQVTFRGRLGGRNVESLAVDAGGLTGGQAVVENVTEGAAVIDATEDAREGGASGWFRIFRSEATTDSLMVYFQIDASSTASAGSDFETLPEYAFLAPGEASADVLVRTIDDGDAEDEETLSITLVAQPEYLGGIQSYAVGQPASATLAIADDDFVGPLLPVSIAVVQHATEGGSEGLFRISRLASSAETITVTYVVESDSTAAPDDYQTLIGSVVIPGGELSADLLITAIDDDLEEGDETLRITLTSVVSSTHTLTGWATEEIRIVDDDVASPFSTVRIADRARGYEAGVNGWFRLSRKGGDLSQPLTVDYTVESVYSTAESGVDFQFLPGTAADDADGQVTFAAGATDVLIPVNPIDDNLAEETEKVRIRLTGCGPGGCQLGLPIIENVRIVDNDLPDKGPYVDWLRLVDDVGHDRVTHDPRVSGMVLGNFHAGSARIEFDHNRDFQPEGSVIVTATASVFTYDPRTADPALATAQGSQVFNYRAVNLAADGSVLETSKWQSLAFQLEPDPNAGPVQLENVRLWSDTGTDRSDRVTINPTLAGTVKGDLENHAALLEFDHDGDGSPEGSVTATTQRRSFRYDPVETDPSLEALIGPFEPRYRLVTTDRITGQVTAGAWTMFSMTLELAPASTYVVTGLAMSEDEEGELATGLPMLTGQVWLGDSYGYGSGDNSCSEQSDGGYGEGDGSEGGSGSYDPSSYSPGSMGNGEGSSSASGGYLSDSSEDPTGGYGVPGQGGGYIDTSGGSNPGGSENGCNSLIVPIELDYDGNGTVDGKTTTSSDGRFRYWPSNLSYGTHTVRARALEWNTEYATYLRGPWNTFTFTWDPEQGPPIESVALVNDTGWSSADNNTSDALVHGKLAVGVNFASEFKIEYDRDDDDAVDGHTWNDEIGEFEFRPRGLSAGYMSLNVRSVRRDPVTGGDIPGAWYAFGFYFEPPQAPQLQTLTLLADTGSAATDRVTYVSTLAGQIVGTTGLEATEIMFDHDGDGQTDGSAEAQEDGSFLYEPAGLAEAAHTVRARTRVWDENIEDYAYSPWLALSFTLEAPPNAVIGVETLGLSRDTGDSATDGVTYNATLAGTLVNDGSVAYQTIEFDHDGDGVADGSTTAAVSGTFTYLPRGLSLGTHTVAARGVEWDYRNDQLLSGPWTTVTFTLEEETNAAPVVQQIGLLSDSGPSSEDGLTANTTLAGQIDDDRGIGGLTIEIDQNGDGTADAVTSTDSQGRFRIESTGLAFGSVSIQVRAVEWDPKQESYLRGAWTTVAFTYEDQPNAAARIVALELAATTAAAASARSTLSGRITNEGTLDKVAVEFDFDGDGTVDQSTLTDADGAFSLPTGDLPPGPATVHVRTRETDRTSNGTLLSAWTAVTVDNTPPTSAPAQVTQFSLVSDDGYSSTDRVTTSARVQGTLDHPGRNEFLIVQFDHDGDGQPDGQVAVGADLQFTYDPQGLSVGDHTVRARTKDYDRNSTAVYSDWSSLQFRLEASAARQPNVGALNLAADTGADDGDFSTSSGTLTGTVAGWSASVSTWVEFDGNGDGTVEGTTAVSNGSFSFTPYNLTQGLNTVRVRMVSSVSSGGTVRGDWGSLSFVYSTDPDGAAAQALAPTAAAMNAAAQAARNGVPGALADSQNAQRTALSAANTQYEDEVGDAATARNSAIEAAQGDHAATLAAADATYASAVAAAQAAFVSNMAAFTGDATQYPIDPITWPDAPAANRVQIPGDDTQPQPPRALPTYTGPQYEWDADPFYQAGKAAVETAYRNGLQSVNQALTNAKQSAQSTYNAARQTANNQHDTAVRAAYQTYWNAVQSPNPFGVDPNVAHQNYANAGQSAADAYRNAWQTHWDTLDAAGDAAYATLTAAISAAWTNYNSNVQPTADAYLAVVNDINATPSQRQSAYMAHRSACHSYGKTRDLDIAGARRQYDIDMADTWQQYRLDMAEADLTYDQAVSAAQASLDSQYNTHNDGGRTQTITAIKTLQQALLDATRHRYKALADAEKIRADAVAEGVRTHAIDTANVTATHWTNDIAERQARLTIWNSVVATPWTAYQLALVHNEAAYTSQRAAAYVTQTAAVADATRAESQAVATAAKTRTYAKADADWLHGKERLDAKVDYWTGTSGGASVASADLATLRQTLRDDLAQVDKDYSDTATDAYYVWSDAASSAYYTYDTTMINARQWVVDTMYCYWGCERVEPADYINASADLNVATTNANHDYRIALIDAGQTQGDERRDAHRQFRDDSQSARDAQNGSSAGDLVTYHKALADADKKHAVQTVKDDGTQRNVLGAIDVAFVSATALADKTFADAQANITRARQSDDATVKRTFQITEATVHVAAMTAWDAVDNSRWSQYHLDLAGIEFNWAIAAGAVDVVQATAAADADRTRALAVAAAAQTLANAHAFGSQTQVNALVTAQNAYADNVGAAKLNFAYWLADQNFTFTSDDNTARSGNETASANFAQTSDDALAADYADYDRAMTDAWRDFAVTAANASRNLALAGYTSSAWTINRTTMQAAGLAYNTAAHTAWDALRTAIADDRRARTLFNISKGETYRADAAGAKTLLAGAIGTETKNLATALKNEAVILATAKVAVDTAYVATVTAAETAHAHTLRTTAATQRVAVKTAETTHYVAQTIAGAAKREDTIAARGLYETGLYADHAAALAAVAVTTGNTLDVYQAAVALADYNWADLLRVAQDLYQDGVSYAIYNRAVAASGAELTLLTVVSNAESAHQSVLIAAGTTRSLALAAADSALYLAHATAEAVFAEAEVFARVDYDSAKADALSDLQTTVSLANTNYATLIADAERTLYLDATDGWSNSWSPGSWGYGWGSGWGGYYGGYYGYYAGGSAWGGGYYSSWGGSGYVYGPWTNYFGWYGGYWGGYYGGYDGGWYGGWGGWNGWGGYYGWGWGGWWGGDVTPTEWENYRTAVDNAADARTADVDAALIPFVTDIGDAQIDRAEYLGDARIDLATARGTAGVAYVVALNAAESGYATATTTAGATLVSVRSAAQLAHDNVLALANQNEVTAQQTAKVNLSLDDGFATIARTGAVAGVEADYHIAVATSHAAAAHALALATLLPADAFDAAYSAANAGWIAAMKPAHVTHETSLTMSDADRAVRLALAWKDREVGRATAETAYTGNLATLQANRAVAEGGVQDTYRAAALPADNTRQTAAAAATNTYELEVATVQKQLALDWAGAEKQYQLDELMDVDTAADDRKLAQADATLEQATDLAEAKLAWSQDEHLTRQAYTLGLATADRNRSQSLATIARTATIDQATYQAALDNAFAVEEADYWLAETLAENTHRGDKAVADVNYWMAREVNRAAAATALNSAVGLPWTQYLEDWSAARVTWWTGTQADYLAWVVNRNLAEGVYQTTLAAQHVAKVAARTTAEVTRTSAVATAAQAKQNSEAAAREAYFASLAGPAQTYADDRAQSEREYARDVAAAYQTFTLTSDYPNFWTAYATYQAAVSTADATRDNTNVSLENTYEAAEANTLAAAVTAEATARHAFVIAQAPADQTQAVAKAQAERNYQVADANSYKLLVQTQAALDRGYWITETAALAAVGAVFAASNATPWADYDAAEAAAYLAWVTSAATAQETLRVATAEAEKNAEIALANGDLTSATAVAAANASAATTVANAELSLATAQSAMIASLGAGGSYQATYPEVSTAPDLAARYTISAASPEDYQATITASYSSNYYYSSWSWYGMGGLGYYSGLGWYGGLGGWGYDGGYGSAYYDAYTSGAGGWSGGWFGGWWNAWWYGYGLTSPSEPQLETGYWNIRGAIGKVVSPDGAALAPYVAGAVPQELVPELVGPTAMTTSASTVPATLGPALHAAAAPSILASPTSVGVVRYDQTEVADILEATDPELGEVWRAQGRVVRIPFEGRSDPIESASATPSLDAQPHAGDRPEQGRASQGVSVVVPGTSTSADVANYISVPSIWDGEPLKQHRAQLRQRVLKHIDHRTPGFELRRTGMFTGANVEYKHHDDVLHLSNNDIIWRSFKFEIFFGGQGGVTYIDTKIGVLAENGWVRLLSGKRALLTAIQKYATAFRGASTEEINDTLDAVTSPYHVESNATQLGIFIGGTNMHFLGLGNVERMYNLYEGTKFYYGGVGNPVDFEDSDILAGAAGRGWDEILDRAMADIRTFLRPGQKIHIFGWSRGAAMANDLAWRLSTEGIRVSFVGMFDPVYSRGLPGQDSFKTDSTWAGAVGNYVMTTITGNVEAAAAIYAINETRSFFPATRFKLLGATKLITMRSPGVHGEVGGHFQSNMPMQQLNLKAMIEFARGYGGASFQFRGIEEDVASILSSPVSKWIATLGGGQDTAKAWDRATRFEHWSPFTTEEYHRQLHSHAAADWSPGGYGFQTGNCEAILVGAGSSLVRSPISYLWDPPQPLDGHYTRNLDWVEREIWQLGLKDSSGQPMQVSEKAKAFIRSLYRKWIVPVGGGWQP